LYKAVEERGFCLDYIYPVTRGNCTPTSPIPFRAVVPRQGKPHILLVKFIFEHYICWDILQKLNIYYLNFEEQASNTGPMTEILTQDFSDYSVLPTKL
jgi:hypothetical protein